MAGRLCSQLPGVSWHWAAAALTDFGKGTLSLTPRTMIPQAPQLPRGVSKSFSRFPRGDSGEVEFRWVWILEEQVKLAS